ncbi:MAG: amidohydrolase [Gammaproteobacteria bacterium]|nr:amidohydrolase [Gammaproteobacteria bacterium]
MGGVHGADAVAPAGTRRYRRIACEESFATPEVIAELSRLAGGKPSMKSGPIAGPFMPELLDLGERRIAGMDAAGVDVQVLALVSPGVQTFAPATALALARDANDRLAAAIRAHPTRFAGLATVAPQAAAESARELDRAITQLGFKGCMINSHTNGEYLDDAKYWPLLEAAQALGVPIYVHPRDPSPGLEGPLAVPGYAVGWGYAVETGTHAVRLMGSGVLDRFPKLLFVLGHLGETLPFLLDRFDNRYRWQRRLLGFKGTARLPSEYFRDNFVVTTSGMNYAAPLQAALAALGPDKVLFAADHPMEDQKEAVDELEAIALPPELKRRIFETNPTRVFRL